MGTGDGLKRGLKRIKRGLREMTRQTQARRSDGSNVQVAGRSNVIVVGNVGREGAAEGASARQTTRIRQHDGVTSEEATTTISNNTGGEA